MHIPKGAHEIILRRQGEGQPVAKLYFFWHPQLLLSYHLILLLKSYDSSPFPGPPNSTHSVRQWILAKTDASRRMPHGESENLELRFTCKYLSSFSSLFWWCANVLAYLESFGKQNTNLFPSLLTFIQGSRAVRGRWDYEDVVVGGSLMGEEQSGKM